MGVAFACGLMLLPACDLPKRPEVGPRAGADTQDDAEPETFEPPELGDWEGPWEAWFVYKRSGRSVGYSHVNADFSTERPEETKIRVPTAARQEMMSVDRDSASIWYDVEDAILFERGDAVFLQTVEQVSRESPTGDLRGFFSRLRVGPSESHSVGVVEDRQLNVETVSGPERRSRTQTWSDHSRGMLAVMQSLRSTPMKAGETRQLKHLLPLRHQLATVRLNAVAETAVPWIDGSARQLLEVVQEVRIDDQPVSESVLWIDGEGEIQRSYTPVLDLIAYRVTAPELERELADQTVLAETLSSERMGTVWSAWVDVGGKRMKDPSRLQRVGYVLTVPETGDQSASEDAVIQPAPDQYKAKAKNGRVQLLVSRRSEKRSENFEHYESSTDSDDRRRTALLDFDHAEIRRLASATFQGRSPGPRDTAMELTRNVSELLERTASVGDFVRASDVAVRLQGGAAEHAVLLAALLRERKIPSRLALGLVYESDDSPRLVFSIWTLAYLDGRWVSLDPIRGKLAPADRIILHMDDTALGIDESVYLSVFRKMESMKVRVHAFTLDKEEAS